jgi:hypothetical protein
MFETETPQYENGNVRSQGEAAWPGEMEAPYGQGEEEYPYGEGEEEYPGLYGEAEEEYPGAYQGEDEYPYGQGEEEYPGLYGEAEEEYPGAYQGEDEYPYGQGEEEYPGTHQGEEEQFLPALGALIPIAGQLLSGVLGGVKRELDPEAGAYRESEAPYSGAEAGDAGEAEEQFLHRILTNVLGQEAEAGESPLSPTQEGKFVSQLMEASDEQELARVIGGIINSVGRTVQGVRGAVNSPQGRALIDAVAPVAHAMLAGEGGPSPVAGEMGELDHEQDEFELARNVVQLASAAAHNVASAPPHAPPQLVGELSIFRAASRLPFTRRLFNHGLRAISPLARRYWGRRYSGFRRGSGYSYGYGYGRPYRRGYWGYGYGPRRRWWGSRRYGYPTYYGGPAEPEPGPGPESPPQPPPQPGYRWVMVPIGAPPPPPEPAGPPPPPPGPEPTAAAPSPEPAAAPPQTEFGWHRRRRRGWRGYRGRRGYRGYGGYSPYGYGGDGDDDDEFGWRRRRSRGYRGYGGGDGGYGSGSSSGAPSGRWVRRRGKIILHGV